MAAFQAPRCEPTRIAEILRGPDGSFTVVVERVKASTGDVVETKTVMVDGLGRLLDS